MLFLFNFLCLLPLLPQEKNFRTLLFIITYLIQTIIYFMQFSSLIWSCISLFIQVSKNIYYLLFWNNLNSLSRNKKTRINVRNWLYIIFKAMTSVLQFNKRSSQKLNARFVLQILRKSTLVRLKRKDLENLVVSL